MKVDCAKCNLAYDDAERSTICPHRPLFADPADLERKKLAITLLGKILRFHHQPEGPFHQVRTMSWNGMVELHDMSGEFAPHLFAVVEPKQYTPITQYKKGDVIVDRGGDLQVATGGISGPTEPHFDRDAPAGTTTRDKGITWTKASGPCSR
jgi:hypothetical protein